MKLFNACQAARIKIADAYIPRAFDDPTPPWMRWEQFTSQVGDVHQQFQWVSDHPHLVPLPLDVVWFVIRNDSRIRQEGTKHYFISAPDTQAAASRLTDRAERDLLYSVITYAYT